MRFLQRVISVATVAVLLVAQQANAQVAPGVAYHTNVTQPFSASSAHITFTSPCRHVQIKTDTGAAAVYVNFNGTATTSNFKIDPGAGQLWNFEYFMTAVDIIGGSADAMKLARLCKEGNAVCI
jgi:photosystem II stability/assembly factor-like uncharacterized protein